MQFYSKPVPEHEEVPLADEGRWEAIVEHWTQREELSQKQADGKSNACYVLSVCSERDEPIQQAQLLEIVNLVSAQGDRIVGEEVYFMRKANPRTLLPKGISEDFADRAKLCGADLFVVDADLSPSQMRNLEDVMGMAVCDREAVILNVFLKHARTRRARIQVEIAQLEYLRPRIRGIGINMDQQAGGIASGRGVGETASELMARKLDGRLVELNKSLRKLERSDETQRHHRGGCKRIVLVGYTNAGKTSLMNALTSEVLSARDMPFETLDTTSRCLSRHGGDILVSDTVGFIRRLPNRLLASFESTLAEICEASLIVIVVDASDYEWEAHLETTTGMLEKLGAEGIPRFYVFNKMDRLLSLPNKHLLGAICDGAPYRLVSSHNDEDVLQLKEDLLSCVRDDEKTLTIFVPYEATEIMSMVYAKCRVSESEPMESGLKVGITGASEVLAKIKEKLREFKK